jgi:hypothetical protein
MNIDARPPVVYPTFHDTQRTNKKQVDIDNSVYHLLSLYLNTDVMLNPTTPLPVKRSVPSWKSNSRSIRTQRNWFGEEHMKKNHQELVLERNTYRNSTIKAHDFDNNEPTKRSRAKSVSFNETVTVILSQDTVSQSRLKQQQQQQTLVEEDVFVDALESFE